MEVLPKYPTARGPADQMTGEVWCDIMNKTPSVRFVAIHFTPGARTAWHTHALGHTLYITEGAGLVQSRGSEIVNVRAGDAVYFSPDEWHWHGAGPDHFMTHIAVTELVSEDENEVWGSHVTEAEYRGEAS